MPHQDATVIATFSRRMTLRLDGGDDVTARIKGRQLKPVCGDRVRAEPLERESEWLITGILVRRNALTRPNLRGEPEVLAANLDRIVIVAAAEPPPDWAIVDRYVAAAENLGIDAIVVYNKTDLDRPTGIDTSLDDYARIGYDTVLCSAKGGDNLETLTNIVSDGTSIIVGQSGVGKSTLINRLVGENLQRTAPISDKRGEGRHTTANSAMIRLRRGGELIDSPGVRDYAPTFASADDVANGFREIRKAGLTCRFADCRHLREPDCSVKQAVAAGAVSRRRYDSYRHLRALTARLAERRGPGGASRTP